MVKANDVFCDVCVKFIRVARKKTRENPFNTERDGPHFCSHKCAKAYYDQVERGKK